MNTKIRQRISITWVAAGLLLIATGFLVDGSTEVGHHAFLILGGIGVGLGGRRGR